MTCSTVLANFVYSENFFNKVMIYVGNFCLMLIIIISEEIIIKSQWQIKTHIILYVCLCTGKDIILKSYNFLYT